MTKRDYIFLSNALGLALAGCYEEEEDGVNFAIEVLASEISEMTSAFDVDLFRSNCQNAKRHHTEHKSWHHDPRS